MVKSIPIFKVMLAEGLVNVDSEADKLFGYCIEANKGPVAEPTYVASSSEAKTKFGVNFAPHFYQKGAGLVLYRVPFNDSKEPSITYKAYIKDYTPAEISAGTDGDGASLKDREVIKITSTTPGTVKHQVNISKSLTSSSAYNLTVTIEDVGSKKYQNLSSLTNVVKKINNKFGDYLYAELLVDEDMMLGKKPVDDVGTKLTATTVLVYDSNNKKYIVKETSAVGTDDDVVSYGIFSAARLHYNKKNGAVVDTLSGGSNGKLLKTNGEESPIEIPDDGINISSDYTKAIVLQNTEESFVGQEFYISSTATPDNSTVYPLYIDEGETPANIYIRIRPNSTTNTDISYEFTSYADAEGTVEWGSGAVATIGYGDNDANMETTLLYAYRQGFKDMEDVNLLGIATLSNSEVVQNELIAHIEGMIDPEVAKYRFGVTGFLKYPALDSNGKTNATGQIILDDLTDSTPHIDNPFIMFIGQGVVFEEDGNRYNLLPHECVQLYTGIRSALDYNQSIFGGNPRKVLNGVVDVLPLTTDGVDIYKEDRETLNEAGVMTFLKKYKEVRFLQGVTTAQDSPVLSHESIMSIVLYVLRSLVEVAWVFLGETLTEDIKSGFAQAISDELKRITDTDNSLMALEDYNIPPYDVEIRATTVTGFNEAGELVRETKLAAIIKIVPRGSIEAIELSVMVI